MKTLYSNYVAALEHLKDVPSLALRIILAYGFLEPALMKVRNFQSVAEWFGSMNYPLPQLSAYLAGFTELSGVVLLALGLGSRIIAIPLIFIMIVAITTVHWQNGFAAGDNGYEIPLYYMLMLFTLMIYGSGRLSIDQLISYKK